MWPSSLNPASVSFEHLAVVPVLYGPLQVLLAILPYILGALAATLLAMLKPAFLKAAGRVLWRNKFAVAGIMVAAVGGIYALSYAWSLYAPRATEAEAGEGEWPAFRGGIARRGSAGGADPTCGAVVWAFDREAKPFFSSPAIVGNRVYVASADKGVFSDRGAIYCLDAATGAVVWKYAPSGFRATFSSPAVAAGYVVCGEGLHFVRDGRITCLDAATGGLKWEFRAASHVESSPCIYDGKAYVGAGDDGLYCIALEPGPDGKPRVLWHLDGRKYPDCEASPLAHAGKVYFALGEQGAAVVCVDAETGSEVWRVETPYPVFAGPTIADGKVFVGMGVGNFIEGAQALWEKRLAALREKKVSDSEIEAARKKYAPAGEVWALDPQTGRAVFKVPLKDTVLSPVAAAGDRLYFGSRDGVVRVINTSGKVLGEWNAREPILAAPAVGQDHVYIVTETGRLYGLDRESLRPVWETRVDSEGSCISSPAVALGHVYVGSARSGLVCVGQPGTARRPMWSGYLGGPGRSGAADTCAPPEDGEVVWQYPKGGAAEGAQAAILCGPPAYLDGSIYVAVQGNPRTGLARLALAARSRDEPKEAWFYPTPNPVRLSAAVGEGRVYLVDGRPGESKRSLHCLEVESGRPLWKMPVADDAPGDLLLGEGFLVIRDAPDRVTLRWLTGEKAGGSWSESVRGAVGGPAACGGLVMVASKKDGLVGLDLATGRRLWARALAATPTTGPVATDDFVAVGTEGGIACASIVDGSPLWQARIGAVAGTLACDDDRVACATAGGEAVVRDWQGREVFRRKGARAGFAPMLGGREVLYVTAKSIERAGAASDKPAAVLEAEWLKDASAPPLLVKSHVYVVTQSKGLVCIGSKE